MSIIRSGQSRAARRPTNWMYLITCLCLLGLPQFVVGQTGVQPRPAASINDNGNGATGGGTAAGSVVPGLAGSDPSPATLPNAHGQIWRTYDLKPYTSRVTTDKPQQAVVDWILRETGTDLWFSEPLGILSASRERLTVYHTPQVQRTVADIVQRLVGTGAESHVVGLRLVTLNSPNWRSQAYSLLQPVTVKSPGVEAWLLTKENTALLLASLRKRTDFREHNSPRLEIRNGQNEKLSRMRPRSFARRVRRRPGGLPYYELEMETIQEGYSLDISPLVSRQHRTIDAVLKCQIDQVEKLVPVPLDIPSLGGAPQRISLQIPQLVSWRLHERFRWPTDKVLLLSCGVVATPGPERQTTFGIPNPLLRGPGRADALLFVESKGPASQTLQPSLTPTAGVPRAARY